VQKSSDGLNFDEVTKISSNPDSIADYFYNYDPTPSDKNEIFFRLKVTDQNNNINYSEIRTVVLSEPGNSISLYPNPSNSFVNVVFSHPINNVLIEILSPTGELIQKYRFNNTSSAHINLISLLPPGVYFIRAYDLDLKKNYVLPFMTQ
jgi:hypothetical protein